MDRPTGRVTEVDVGTPPYATDGWDTFKFNFHGFAALPAETGRAVETSKVSCFGHDWWLKLYPGGKRSRDRGMVTIYLHKSTSSNAKPISIRYELNVKDADGRRITNYASDETEFTSRSAGWGWNDFIKYSHVMDPTKDVLVDGALVVQLQMKSLQKNTGDRGLPCRPFVPANSCRKKMEALWCQDENYTDVSFVIRNDNKKSVKMSEDDNDDDDDDNDDEEEESTTFDAHRAILQACAPGLFELCGPYDDEKRPSIPLTNVEPDVFHLLLSYIYGQNISTADWKEHGRDLIEAADRYLLSDLKLEAEARYVQFAAITAENAIDLLLYADAKNCALLKESVMDYFVKNGRDALRLLSFEDIPNSRSLFTDLLLALSVNNEEVEGEGRDDIDASNYKVMRISTLRRELDRLGLDTDGSREALIKRLETTAGETHDEEGDEDDNEEDADDGIINTMHGGSNADIGLDDGSDDSSFSVDISLY